MYFTYTLVLVFLAPFSQGITSVEVPVRYRSAEYCAAEAKRLWEEQRAFKAFCVKTEQP